VLTVEGAKRVYKTSDTNTRRAATRAKVTSRRTVEDARVGWVDPEGTEAPDDGAEDTLAVGGTAAVGGLTGGDTICTPETPATPGIVTKLALNVVSVWLLFAAENALSKTAIEAPRTSTVMVIVLLPLENVILTSFRLIPVIEARTASYRAAI
jgi:hypothetical protein